MKSKFGPRRAGRAMLSIALFLGGCATLNRSPERPADLRKSPRTSGTAPKAAVWIIRS